MTIIKCKKLIVQDKKFIIPNMIISATLSKPVSNIEEIMGKAYEKIKITAQASSEGQTYFCELFTQKQVFHKHLSPLELEDFLQAHAGTSFKVCVKRTESQEITILANKKGKISVLTKNTNLKLLSPNKISSQKKKNYLIPEGSSVPFMQLLGLMNSEGKVISQKFDKFRQINRFLEFIDDIIPDVIAQIEKEENLEKLRPIRIADFGCGKSYLTFAVHYYLTEIKKIPCSIEGLDLKKEIIDYCNDICTKLKLENLIFHTGNISDYSGKLAPDIVITLHACDTATDYALEYAVEKGAKAILSVPCCQHEINTQLDSKKIQNIMENAPEFSPLLKWGLIKERFSSLLTDSLRGEWLENHAYKVQMLEFIDMEHTPKNLLIRAIKNPSGKEKDNVPSLLNILKLQTELWK